jgi:hypothetical protein
MGILIRLTDLVSVWYPISPSKGWVAFLTCAYIPPPPHQTIYRYSRLQWDQQVLLPPEPSWSRAYGLEAWKQNGKPSSSNINESQFLPNDLAVVPFKLTII